MHAIDRERENSTEKSNKDNKSQCILCPPSTPSDMVPHIDIICMVDGSIDWGNLDEVAR